MMQHRIFGPMHKGYEEYAELIHESGNHLLNLVSDLLDLAKIEAGRFTIDPTDIELAETVDYCFRLIQRRADSSEIVPRQNHAGRSNDADRRRPRLQADPCSTCCPMR